MEAELGISLPAAYKRVVTAFPIPAWAGNAETDVWDNAKRLIELNRELRAGSGVKPWPPTMFALGRDQGGCTHALDLASGEVWWADRCHLDAPGSYRLSVTLEAWLEQSLRDLRSDLEADAIDPDGTPDERQLRERDDPWSAGCIITLLVVLGLVVLMRILDC